MEVQRWGEEKLDFMRTMLPFARGIPSHDTLNKVLNALGPNLFSDCFTAWVEALREAGPDIVAVDSKSSRPARAKGGHPLHVVSAWAMRQRLVLGQEAVGEKANEIVAIPFLLERLHLTGTLGDDRCYGHPDYPRQGRRLSPRPQGQLAPSRQGRALVLR